MRADALKKWGRVVGCVIVAAAIPMPASANSSATYSYDEGGQLRSAVYDNGSCVAYVYDAAGNRTSQTTTVGGTPVEATWGDGNWGCFKWTAP